MDFSFLRKKFNESLFNIYSSEELNVIFYNIMKQLTDKSKVELLTGNYKLGHYKEKLFFEYINRLLGVLAGFSVLLMFIFSFFLQNNKKVFIPLTSILLISIGFQAWLGKLVVDSNLAAYKISTHLLMAIIIVLLMVYNIKKTDEIKN